MTKEYTQSNLMPDFVVAGVLKCGTSWLHDKLRLHPGIRFPSYRKELDYFSFHYDRGPEWYASFFEPAADEAANTIRGEVSPTYFDHPEAFARMSRDIPGCRVIAILRNPVDRLYSQYSHWEQHTNEGLTFPEFLECHPNAFETGRYAYHLARLYEYFPEDRVRLLMFEHVMAEPVLALRELVALLGADPAEVPNELPKGRVNPSYRPRFPRAQALANSLKRSVRSHDQEWMVRAAKKVGVARLFGNAGRFEPLDAEMRRELAGRYAGDVASLTTLRPDLDLSPWVDFGR